MSDERVEVRLDQHGERLAKLEQARVDFKETVQREADQTRQEMRTYFKPMSEKTAKMCKSVATLEADNAWIKPWVKRLMYGGGLAATIAVVYEIVRASN